MHIPGCQKQDIKHFFFNQEEMKHGLHQSTESISETICNTDGLAAEASPQV